MAKLNVALTTMVLMTTFALSASAQSGRYGTGITVYAKPNFTGQSATFRTDVPDLRVYSLNDKISSLDIPNGESWEVCQDINYANRCQVFSGSLSDLRPMGWNGRISSLRRVNNGVNNGVFNGRQENGVFLPNASGRSRGLVLYDRPFYRGTSTMVNNDTNVGLGSRLGSAQVRGGAWQLCDRNGRCATVTQDVPNLSQLGLSGRITSARLLNGSQVNGAYGRERRFEGR
jgi:hypothetical protein